MNVPVVLMAMAAGISVHAALSHALVGLSRRPRDRVRLAFAVEASAVAVGSLAVIALYSASSPEGHAAVAKWVFFPAGVLWLVSTVWMVAFYTAVRPRRFLFVLSAAFAAVLVIDLSLPLGLLHRVLGHLVTVSLFGAQVTMFSDPTPHPLNQLNNALVVAAFSFVGYAAWKKLRDGEVRRAVAVGLFGAVFAGAVLADTLADYGFLSSLYLTQLTFAALVIAVSIGLRQQTVRDERALADYRRHLETMVEERVREVDATNNRLSEEVQERLATEEALRQRVRELDILQEVSQKFAYRSDLITALGEVEPRIATLLGGRYAWCRLIPSQGTDEEEGLDPERDERAIGIAAAFHALRGQAMVTFAGPEWVALTDALRRRAEAEGVDHLLVVQLSVPTGPVGVLTVGRQGEFSAHECGLAQTVADNLARVIENERLHEAQTRQAAERERQHLARELHDAVTQTIYSAALIGEALPTVWEREPEEGLRNLERLRRLVRGALAEMRTMLFELRPAALEAAPLDSLLERLAEALSGQIQVPVHVDIAQDVLLPQDVKLAVYRVVQEAFNNISKYAHASRVTLTLGSTDELGVTMLIHDDGVGFDPDHVPQESMGLRIMRERLEKVHGALSVRSTRGAGTSIGIVWPAQAAVGLGAEGRNDRERSGAH